MMVARLARSRRPSLWPMILGVALHPLAYAPWILLPGWAIRTIYAGPTLLVGALGLVPVLGWWFAARGAFALLAVLGIVGLFAWPALVFHGAVLLHDGWHATHAPMRAGQAVLGLQWLLYPVWVFAMWRAAMAKPR